MKCLLSLLLLSVFLITTTHAAHAQNILDQAGRVFQNLAVLDQNNKYTILVTAQPANQTASQDTDLASNSSGTKEVQTEQDKVVKNVSQVTGQAAKRAGETLSSVGSQVGEAFKNLTGLGQEGNASSK
jgi:hypothetical protein